MNVQQLSEKGRNKIRKEETGEEEAGTMPEVGEEEEEEDKRREKT